jgi:hypothetical protein
MQKKHLNLKIKRRAKFLRCIIKKGKKCEHCGIDLYKNHWLAEFHHINPAEKDNDISTLIKNKWTHISIDTELDKCLLLCCNCHRTEHFDEERAEFYRTHEDSILNILKEWKRDYG